jgi:hypothetical protein
MQMFPDCPIRKRERCFREIHQIQEQRIEPTSNGRQKLSFSRRNAPREIKMSIFESLGRYGAAIKHAHDRNKARRLLNSLPPEMQKDIGWPVSPRSSEKAGLTGAIWSAAR